MRVVAIYGYPVKGLRPVAWPSVELVPDDGIPGDRRFAIVRGDARVTPSAPGWLKKQQCVQLMRDPALARIDSAWDPVAETLTLYHGGGPATTGSPASADGRAALDGWINAFLGPRPEGPARLIERGALSFTDVPENGLSLLNLASVRDLGRRMGIDLDPHRFRANVWIDGAEPWAERGWVGHDIQLGAVRVHVLTNIKRCAATTVHPTEGRRDADVLRALHEGYGHVDMGLYASVQVSGRLVVDDTVTVPTVREGSRAASRLRWWRFYLRSARILVQRGKRRS